MDNDLISRKSLLEKLEYEVHCRNVDGHLMAPASLVVMRVLEEPPAEIVERRRGMSGFNYLKERTRMLNSLGRISGYCTGTKCIECPFGTKKNGTDCTCGAFESEYPDEATEVVRKWAEEHPVKTYESMLLEKFPDADIERIRDNVCPGYFFKTAPTLDECPGYIYDACTQCWNQEVNDEK